MFLEIFLCIGAQREWKVENLSPGEAGVVLCRRSGAGLKGRGLRVVSSDPQLTRARCPQPGLPDTETQCLWCRRGWTKIETFESLFHRSWKGRGNPFGFQDITTKPCSSWSLWRNRLARSAVNRKVGGSSPPRDGLAWTLVTF